MLKLKGIKFIHVIILFLLLVLIWNVLYFSYKMREGLCVELGKLPKTELTITLNEYGNSPPAMTLPLPKNPVAAKVIPPRKYTLNSEYDETPTEFTIVVPTGNPSAASPEIKANVLLLSTTQLILKPIITTKTDDKYSFPKKFIFTILFPSKGPTYYLTDEATTNNINGANELNINTLAGSIVNSSYKNVGAFSKDANNPYLYTLNLTDSEGIETIKMNFTTNMPNTAPTTTPTAPTTAVKA